MYVFVMKIKFLLLLPLTGFFLLLTGCVVQPYTVATPPPGPSLAQIQSMVQGHVSDTVIVGQIQNSSTRYQLTPDQIITLKKAGASDAVLNALINSVSKPVVQTTTVVAQPAYAYPYPYVYVNPWWGPGPYYYGGYYRGGFYYRR
jgi:hypothetical protein